MIKVARNGASPASVPPINFGSWCDDNNFYFFETQVEADNYIASITTAPTKRDWELQEVEPAVRQYMESVIREKPYDYININEPNTWLGDEEYGAQAQMVISWIRECWIVFTKIVSEATEQNNPTIEDIISQLPELSV